MKFSKFARACSYYVGTSWAFGAAFTLVLLWALSGPFFNFSGGWQLVINTSTTIITFIMVFLIQHSQNHDTKAMHEKLDEIILSLDPANNKFARIENLEEQEIAELDKLHDDIVQ